MRSFNAKHVAEAVAFFLSGERDDFDAIEWISNHENIALVNDNNDMAVFEHETPKVVTGHYYFRSRGRQAVNAGKEFLNELFVVSDTQLIRGLSPLTNLGARWMNRQLGFTSHGVVHTTTGPHELVMLHRKDHNEFHLREPLKAELH